jgi:hypothetical protein
MVSKVDEVMGGIIWVWYGWCVVARVGLYGVGGVWVRDRRCLGWVWDRCCVGEVVGGV